MYSTYLSQRHSMKRVVSACEPCNHPLVTSGCGAFMTNALIPFLPDRPVRKITLVGRNICFVICETALTCDHSMAPAAKRSRVLSVYPRIADLGASRRRDLQDKLSKFEAIGT
jgi:hypothetical protein